MRDRGDRYGPIEWAQKRIIKVVTTVTTQRHSKAPPLSCARSGNATQLESVELEHKFFSESTMTDSNVTAEVPTVRVLVRGCSQLSQ